MALLIKNRRIRYARSGDFHIAYETRGVGATDVILILPTLAALEMLTEPPANRLNFDQFARLISFDRRGTGLSDPVIEAPTLEEQMADIVAVLDAAHSDRVAVYSEADGAMMAAMFAATHPDRVSHLILLHGCARLSSAPGYDFTWSEEERQALFVEPMLASWGTGDFGEVLAPVMAATDPDFEDWWARWQRLSGSPGGIRPIMELAGRMDVRCVLPQIQAPTLVLDRPAATGMNSRHADYLAEHIPGAIRRDLPGRDAISFGDGHEALIEAMQEFISGVAPSKTPQRALSTVLFTDIVESTQHAAELGDSRWRVKLEEHDALTRKLVASHGGKAIKSTGDGFLATFDGPARGIRCAAELIEAIRPSGLELRAGLHTGEIELIGEDVAGMAVHIGARIGALGGPGEVLTSSTVRDLVVGSGIEFEPRGQVELKGVPGSWSVHAAVGVG